MPPQTSRPRWRDRQRQLAQHDPQRAVGRSNRPGAWCGCGIARWGCALFVRTVPSERSPHCSKQRNIRSKLALPGPFMGCARLGRRCEASPAARVQSADRRRDAGEQSLRDLQSASAGLDRIDPNCEFPVPRTNPILIEQCLGPPHCRRAPASWARSACGRASRSRDIRDRIGFSGEPVWWP